MLDEPNPHTQNKETQDSLHTEAKLRSGQYDEIKLDDPFLLNFLRLEHLNDAKNKANPSNDRNSNTFS